MSNYEYVLETNVLSKNYKRLKAVNRLSLKIKKGTVFGILGPNGSGKTTTLGMVLGVTRQNSGNFTWFEEGSSNKERQRIGALLEHPNFYPHLTAFKNLRIVAMIKGVKISKIDEVLEKVHLLDRKHHKFKTYSLGMKQRLAIAAALLSDPEVLVFDEPTNGLDPQGIADIRALITEISKHGKTIILASHLLDEVQKVCTDFAVLRKGNLIYEGKVNDDFSNEIVVDLGAVNLDKLEKAITTYEHYQSHTKISNLLRVNLLTNSTPELLGDFLFENKIVMTHIVHKKQNLEEKFLEILENTND